MAGQVLTYDRGSQAVILAAATGAAGDKQVGTAAPVNSNVYALPPIISRGANEFNFSVQLDTTGTVTVLSVDILASLDGVKFGVIATITDVSATSYTPIAGTAIRFLTAAVNTVTGGGSVKVSFAA